LSANNNTSKFLFFSELRFARQTAATPQQDVFAEITTNPAQLFVQGLQTLLRQQQDPIMPLIQLGLGQDAKLWANIQAILEQQGVQLAYSNRAAAVVVVVVETLV
jgi:hypothetical protein